MSNVVEGVQISSGYYTGYMAATTTVGCFALQTPLIDHGPYIFQSSGNCQKICYSLQQPVMAMSSGTNCSCGALLPPKNSQVSSDQCSTGCVGYDQESCGGDNLWWVLLTGQSRNKIPNLELGAVSSTSSQHQSPVGPATVYKTMVPAEPTGNNAQPIAEIPAKPNTAGIAAGVVVGLLVLAAMITGVWFFLRRRKLKLEEQEMLQKQSVQQFVAGGRGRNPFANSQSSMNDNRLDHDMLTSRRQSDGSIMDNQDYSRRILKVTNPESRRQTQSGY